MTQTPPEYHGSSHNGNSGRASNRLLTPHAEYLALSADEVTRHAAYKTLFAAGEELAFVAAIRNATNSGVALIGESVKATLSADIRRRLERRPPGPPAKPQGGDALDNLELDLGLRPRTS